jgi:hypothetical protein
MVATPRNHGGVLLYRVRYVVVNAGAICITDSLCVPCKTHGLRAIPNGKWEGWDGSCLDLVTDGFCLQCACLVRTKQSFVELRVFHTRRYAFLCRRGGGRCAIHHCGRERDTAHR